MALTDEQLEIISEALLPLFQYLEREVICDVANRIKESLAYTRSAELKVESMQRMGYSPAKIRAAAMKMLKADADFQKMVAENTMEHKKEVKKLLSNILGIAQEEKDGILADCADMSYFDDLRIWEEGGKRLTDSSYLPQLVNAIQMQTKESLNNLAGTTGFKTMSGFEAMEDLYRRELDKALIKVCTGTFSREQVVHDVVHNLADSGLRTIDFASGYSMQLDTAVRLAMRTGAHQVAAKITDKNIENTGENLVRVSTHWGARNKGTGHANHEQWQGKVYFIREGQDYRKEARRIGQDYITDLWQATGYSVDGQHDNDPVGLYGYNCRHRHYPWFLGISELPKEEPEPQPVTINGKTYDYYAISQRQRAMERSIRALKREREALKSLNVDTKQISVRIKQKIKEYEEFSEAAKVAPRHNRLRYECGTSDLKKTKAWKRHKATAFEAELEAKSLGAGDKVGDGKEPVCIGQIDPDKREIAIEYFGEQIRDSEIEKLYIIDKAGNVYYNEGKDDAVSIGKVDLTDCIVLHNHPKTNGIVSFGETDFVLMRDFQKASYRLVNEKYNYIAEIIKPIDNLNYNQLWIGALELVDIASMEDYQHLVMEYLKKEGYVKYVRSEVDRKAGQTD